MSMTHLIPAPKPTAIRSLTARKYARKSKADRTLDIYAAAWSEFRHFAEDLRSETALPAQPATVIDYLTDLAEHGAKTSTIQVKLAAIAWRHRIENHPDPTTFEDVKAVMAGIRRTLGTAPQKKAPATLKPVRAMISALPDSLVGHRNRALLLIGYAGAFRRSELVALDVADLRFGDGVLRIVVRRSKADQEARGQIKIVPELKDKALCPVRALRAWFDEAGIRSGAIFRRVDRHGHVHGRLTAQSVALIVKEAARRAGLDARQFAGHSLRSGFITEAAGADEESRDIMAQTGHASEATMRGYIQDAGRGAASAVRAAFGEK